MVPEEIMVSLERHYIIMVQFNLLLEYRIYIMCEVLQVVLMDNNSFPSAIQSLFRRSYLLFRT